MQRAWNRVAATLGGWEARYRTRSLGPFEPTRWVWSRGLALSCDHNGGLLFVRGQRGSRAPLRFNPADFERVKDGDLVWTRLIALPQFLREALPRIQARFGLVTGDEDWSIPKSFDGSSELLESPKLVHWFTQNLDAAAAAYQVGYGSPSQITREYVRQFGTPPRRDVESVLRPVAP